MTRIVQESHSRLYIPDSLFITVASICWPLWSFDWSNDLQVLPPAINPQPVTMTFESSSVTEQPPSAKQPLLIAVTWPLIIMGPLEVLFGLAAHQMARPIRAAATIIAKIIIFLCFTPTVYSMMNTGDGRQNKKTPAMSRLFICNKFLVHERGLEPPRPCEHSHLKAACLPFHHSCLVSIF